MTNKRNRDYDLERFEKKQDIDHSRALRELRNGRKAGCWSWWIFPTPPFIRNGQRIGSPMNQVYELIDDDEGLAYLAFNNLRANYLEIVTAMNDSLAAGVQPRMLLGIDVPRALASVTYFEKLASMASDAELGEACCHARTLLTDTKPACSSGGNSKGGKAAPVSASSASSSASGSGKAAARKPIESAAGATQTTLDSFAHATKPATASDTPVAPLEAEPVPPTGTERTSMRQPAESSGGMPVATPAETAAEGADGSEQDGSGNTPE